MAKLYIFPCSAQNVTLAGFERTIEDVYLSLKN